MRLASFAAFSLAFLAACEPDSEIRPVEVQWMDWPAEVVAGQSFPVRMIVFQPCSATGFRDGSSADQFAVTFAPYFMHVEQDVLCARQVVLSIAPGALDTIGQAPGLPAEFSRSYEMRGSASVAVPQPRALADLPVRTFGQVTVRPADPDPSRRNAGGVAAIAADEFGCLRIRPLMTFEPASVPLADQGGPVLSAFLRGYYADAAEPVCGETRVFHLVAVN